MPSVSALHVYPIKSCRALDLQAVRFDFLGPLYDRRFMLVDEHGAFLTQRELPRLALIVPRLGPVALQISAPDMPMLKVPMTQRDARRLQIQVWKHRGEGEDAGDAAADWFSSFLERPCRLVRFPEDAVRSVSKSHTELDAKTAFSDGYPILLISQASLDDLNGRLSQRLPMSRFRPNIVVRGCAPYAEDTWKRIRIGNVVLEVVKPCARCTITTVDQLTAITGKEPLATLATYRLHESQVLFGQNCIHHGPGSIRIDDDVEVLQSA